MCISSSAIGTPPPVCRCDLEHANRHSTHISMVSGTALSCQNTGALLEGVGCRLWSQRCRVCCCEGDDRHSVFSLRHRAFCIDLNWPSSIAAGRLVNVAERGSPTTPVAGPHAENPTPRATLTAPAWLETVCLGRTAAIPQTIRRTILIRPKTNRGRTNRKTHRANSSHQETGHRQMRHHQAHTTRRQAASGLASQFNGDGTSPVTASVSGSVITLRAKAAGAVTNYSLSVTYSSQAGSFSASASGANLTGGTDGGAIVYDAGNVQVSVGTFTTSVPYGQSTNSTPTTVASALASALNASGSPVTAGVSGSSITINYKAP